MEEPVYKYKGKLYSNKSWTDGTAKYAGDVSDLINLLVKKGKINVDIITCYYLRDSNSDTYTDSPNRLLQYNLDELGVEVEE